MNNVMDQEERLFCVSLVANLQYAAEEKMNHHLTAQIVSTSWLITNLVKKNLFKNLAISRTFPYNEVIFC